MVAQYSLNGALTAAVIHLDIPYNKIFYTLDISVALLLEEKSDE